MSSDSDDKVRVLHTRRKNEKQIVLNETETEILERAKEAFKDPNGFALLVTFTGENRDEVSYTYVGVAPPTIIMMGTLELLRIEFTEKYMGRMPSEE